MSRGANEENAVIWTTAWAGHTVGYAHSPDLIHWSEEKAVPVMEGSPDVANCWAPEIDYDESRKEFVIFWASTIPGKFSETLGTAEKENNHRIYCTTTKDFNEYTPSRLFFDPGFVVIDTTFLRMPDQLCLIFKDETLKPVRKNLRFAKAAGYEGPFTEVSAPFTRDWVEGPTAARVGADYVIYFDCYRDHHYGAMRTRDMKNWEDVTAQISMPRGARHGTIIAVPEQVVAKLRKEMP